MVRMGRQEWRGRDREGEKGCSVMREAGPGGKQAGNTHLLAPSLVVGVQEEKAGSRHWAQSIPRLRSGQ